MKYQFRSFRNNSCSFTINNGSPFSEKGIDSKCQMAAKSTIADRQITSVNSHCRPKPGVEGCQLQPFTTDITSRSLKCYTLILSSFLEEKMSSFFVRYALLYLYSAQLYATLNNLLEKKIKSYERLLWASSPEH